MDLFALFSFVAKAAVVFVALVVTVACNAAFEAFTVVILESTYVFTAFCVGNKTSLVPNAVVVDLFAEFSLTIKPGTVGASAVPLKSPANFIFPFTVVVASGIVAIAMEPST